MITGMPRIAIAVADFPAVIATFTERLEMPVVDISEETIGSLGAKVAMCAPDGGSNIEIMSPGNPDTPLSQSVQRFIDHRGEGLFALMLEAADPDVEAEGLLARGLNVLPLMKGAGGRDVHPNSTHGTLIRVYPTDSYVVEDSDHVIGPNSPGLTGVQRVIMPVADLEQARATYGEKFALETSEPTTDIERGVRSVICTPPTGGVIELVAVEDASKAFARSIGDFLAGNNKGMYALVLQCNDLQQAEKTLISKGIGVTGVTGLNNVLELDPTAMFNIRFWIELENNHV